MGLAVGLLAAMSVGRKVSCEPEGTGLGVADVYKRQGMTTSLCQPGIPVNSQDGPL